MRSYEQNVHTCTVTWCGCTRNHGQPNTMSRIFFFFFFFCFLLLLFLFCFFFLFCSFFFFFFFFFFFEKAGRKETLITSLHSFSVKNMHTEQMPPRPPARERGLTAFCNVWFKRILFHRKHSHTYIQYSLGFERKHTAYLVHLLIHTISIVNIYGQNIFIE